jgi:uncharacterized membrane protein YoaK (UPF0700 family)
MNGSRQQVTALIAIALTFGSGAMDVASFTKLGGVFTSVMTGNIVLCGLAIARGSVSLIAHTVTAFAGYVAGVAAGTRIAWWHTARTGAPAPHKGVEAWAPHVRAVFVAELVPMAGFLAGWEAAGASPSGGAEYLLLAAAAAAMGMQSAAVTQMGLSDVSTTYLTGTLTRLVGSLASPRRQPERPEREGPIRPAVLLGLLAGALLSGLLVKTAAAGVPAVPLAALVLVVLLSAAPPEGLPVPQESGAAAPMATKCHTLVAACADMRPALKAGLLPVWRDQDTLQLGVDWRRAVALEGLGPAAAVISLLDGSRDRAEVIATAGTYGVPAAAASRVLTLLAVAGVLDDFPAPLYRSLPDELRARLEPELATASLAYQDSDGGARTLARRRDAFVRVHGAGRTGASVATLLAAAGVGRVACTDPVPVSAADVAPGGALRADLGDPRGEAAARAVRRIAPETRTADFGGVPDLTILTTPYPAPDLIAMLMRDGVPHLAVRATEAIGVVGPLVRPGRSTCLRCVDLRRAEADPAWPKVLAQATCARPRPEACGIVLAVTAATVAAGQALAFIDAAVEPVAVNGTLELVLPGWQWRRRTWGQHAACSCSAPRAREWVCER